MLARHIFLVVQNITDRHFNVAYFFWKHNIVQDLILGKHYSKIQQHNTLQEVQKYILQHLVCYVWCASAKQGFHLTLATMSAQTSKPSHCLRCTNTATTARANHDLSQKYPSTYSKPGGSGGDA